MEKIAVFPGSFDPITKGHESVIKRALPLFDRIVVAMGVNTSKNYLFPKEQRLAWLKEIFADEEKIEVREYSKLTVDFCKEIGAKYLLRGLRNSLDFNYEKNIAHMNQAMRPDIETIFILTTPDLAAINASIVREIYKNNGEIQQFIPQKITIPQR